MYTDCTRSGGTRSGNVIMVIEVSQRRFVHSHFLLQKQSLCSVSYLRGGATLPSDDIFWQMQMMETVIMFLGLGTSANSFTQLQAKK